MRVLITDSDNRSALAATRRLGRAGYEAMITGELPPASPQPYRDTPTASCHTRRRCDAGQGSSPPCSPRPRAGRAAVAADDRGHHAAAHQRARTASTELHTAVRRRADICTRVRQGGGARAGRCVGRAESRKRHSRESARICYEPVALPLSPRHQARAFARTHRLGLAFHRCRLMPNDDELRDNSDASAARKYSRAAPGAHPARAWVSSPATRTAHR